MTDGYKYLEQDVSLDVADELTDVNLPNGTVVEVEFPGLQIVELLNTIYSDYFSLVPDSLAGTPETRFQKSLEYYFRNYSYAGNVSKLLNQDGLTDVSVSISIVSDPDNLPKELNDGIKDILKSKTSFDVEFPAKHWDFEDVVASIDKRRRKPLILNVTINDGRIGNYNANYVWVRKLTTVAEYKELLTNPHMLKPPDPDSFALFFSQVSGIYVVIGQRERIREINFEGPRRFVAANGIPSAHLIYTPYGVGALGYVSNIHMIINLKARMNYGKQTITNTRLIGEVNRYFRDAFRSTLKNVAEGIVGRIEGGSSAEDIQPTDEETDIITRPDLQLPELNFKKEPRDENSLIAIFFELLGKEYLKGYKIFSLSQKSRYDGKGIMKLSNQKEIPEPKSDNSLKNIEFKVKLWHLVTELADYTKDASELTLIVVWEDDFSARGHPNIQIMGIEHSSQGDKRMDGVTKVLLDARTGKEIQVLVIKEFIDEYAKQQK